MKKIAPHSPDEKKTVMISLSILAAISVMDQVTKAFAEKLIQRPIEVIPGFFSLVIVRNTGAAWGMMAGQRWLLTAISVFCLVGAVIFFRRLTEGWRERFYALGLVLGGVIGNSCDRLWRGGAVLDFLDFYYKEWHWPAFNVADSAICVGVGIFVLSSWLRPEKKEVKVEPPEEANSDKAA